eukprot:sb/3478682/
MKLGRYVNFNVLWPGVPGKRIDKMRTDRSSYNSRIWNVSSTLFCDIKSRFLFKRQGGLFYLFSNAHSSNQAMNRTYARLKKRQKDAPCRLNKKRDYRDP